jgi:hypothetical protein
METRFSIAASLLMKPPTVPSMVGILEKSEGKIRMCLSEHVNLCDYGVSEITKSSKGEVANLEPRLCQP